MKIGFDAKRAFLNQRGLGNYSRTLLQGLAQYAPQYDYTLFTPKSTESLWKAPELFHIKKPEGLAQLFPSLWRSFGLSTDIKKLDLYHGLSHELPFGIHRLPVKKVVTIHDLLFLKQPQFFSWFDQKIYLEKVLYSVKSADLIIAVSEQTKKDLVQLLRVKEKKIQVVYQSCSPLFYEHPFFEKDLSTYGVKAPYILNIGAFTPNKNQLTLLKAFKKLGGDSQLVLIGQGSGSYFNQIQKFIQENKLSSQILMLKNVPLTDLPSFYYQAQVFCFPSLYEGFGIPNIEANFCGTPIITSKGSCLEESAGPHSLFIDSKNVVELFEAIESVTTIPQHQKELRDRRLNFSQKFHLKKTTNALLEAYQNLA